MLGVYSLYREHFTELDQRNNHEVCNRAGHNRDQNP